MLLWHKDKLIFSDVTYTPYAALMRIHNLPTSRCHSNQRRQTLVCLLIPCQDKKIG